MDDSIKTLADAGAHFVLTKGKRAVKKGWQDHKPDVNTVSDWIKEGEGHKIGLMPYSLRLIVIDIDKPKTEGDPEPAEEEAAISEKFEPPLASVETPSGGQHLFYKSVEEGVGNVKWRSGDIRHSSGYVAVYDIEAVCNAITKFPDAEPMAVGDFLSEFGKVGTDQPTGVSEKSNWAPGNRNTTLFQKALLAGVHDDNGSLTKAKQDALNAGLEDAEVEKTADNGWKVGEAALQKGVMQAKDQNNFLAISHAMGWRFRYNVRTAKAEISSAIFSKKHEIIQWYDWDGISDLWRAKIASDIETNFRVVKGKGSIPFKATDTDYERWILATVFDKQVDPFHDYLVNHLSQSEWDGTPRLDTLLIDLFGAKDDALTRWAGRYLPLAAIQRLDDPGCKLDEIPVLFGPQGVGKSAFPAALLGRGEFFRDSLNLSGYDKEQVEAMIGGVIIELAELTGVQRAHTDHLKAFLTRQADNVRMAYRRDPTRILRRCVFIGTTDREEILPNDPAGNRRFVVIECPGIEPDGRSVEKFMDEHRGQIWAEALLRSDKGDVANLPRELREQQAARNQQYRSGDEYLEGLVERLPLPDPVGGYTMADIYSVLSLPSNVSKRAFAEALRVRGWTKVRKRVDNQQAKRWFPPSDWSPREAAM